MKKVMILLIAVLFASTGAFAQITSIAFSEVDGIQTLTPWWVKFNTSHHGQNLEVNDLIAVAVGKAILPSGDTIVSADSLVFQQTTPQQGLPSVMQVYTNTENTTIDFFVETKIVDTIGGGYVVIDTHTSPSLSATTAFLNGAPDSWNESFKDTTSGGITLVFDADGQNGSWFSVVQESGPGSIVSQPVYVEGQQDSVEIQITNCQPNSQYTIRVYGDAGNNVALHTSGFLTFTTEPVTGPLVYLSPEDSSSSHLEVEYTVIGNGSNTPYTLSFDGNVVLNGSTSDTVTGTLPSSGLNFSTPYTWSLSASNLGGSAAVDLIMSTTGLDALSLGGVTHDSTGLFEVGLMIPTYSDGGPSDVIVHHPESGMSYAPSPSQVSAGNDTTYVTIPNLTPGETEEVIIQLNRIADGEMETWSYYINMWEPGEVSISTVQPNQPVSNSHSVVIDVDRSINVGGVSANLTLELQTQAQPPQWTQVDVQNMYASSGSIQDTVSYQNLVASSVYRLTILGQDSVSPHTDNTEILVFTTGPVPNNPSVSFVSPIDWDAPDWIAHVQMNFNTMSPTGGTGYLRASNNLSNLYTPLSNVYDEVLSAGWTQNVMMYVDIEPYIQAGYDTLYYLGYVVNNEGGWSYTQEWAVALPELEPEPDPEGPLVYLGGQANDVDTSEALVQVGFTLNSLDSVEIEIEWLAFGGFNGTSGLVSVTSMNTNVYLGGLPPDKTINCDVRAYIAGIDQGIVGSFSFDTDAVPEPVDPSGIRELLMQTPNVRGDLIDILGRTITSGVPLIEMERGWYQFNADVVIWTDREGHSKRYVNRFH